MRTIHKLFTNKELFAEHCFFRFIVLVCFLFDVNMFLHCVLFLARMISRIFTFLSTKSYLGYYSRKCLKWAKTACTKALFLPSKKTSTKGWNPPKKQEVGPRSRPYLLGIYQSMEGKQLLIPVVFVYWYLLKRIKWGKKWFKKNPTAARLSQRVKITPTFIKNSRMLSYK